MSTTEELPRRGYRVDEVAKLIGCSEAFVWKLIKEGKLRSAKVGRVRIVPADALEAILSDDEAS